MTIFVFSLPEPAYAGPDARVDRANLLGYTKQQQGVYAKLLVFKYIYLIQNGDHPFYF